jgi:hypothetical protein
MRNVLFAAGIAVLLAGCATVSNPVPADYKGPVVSLTDTGATESGSKARFFAAIEVDGTSIDNAIRQTRISSHGQGFALSARYTSRNAPVRPMKVKLLGTHQTAAPIHEIASRMAGTFFSIEGVVDFKPTEGKQYEVTGELAKERSCVWISEVGTNAVVTERICTK